MKKQKKKNNKIVLVERSKLNSIENIISKELKDHEISHDDFTAIINEERNYHELEGSIRKMKIQRNDIEKDELMEDGKRMGIDEDIKQNKNLKS